MGVPYDTFVGAFLAKISEYDFSELMDHERNDLVDGYMKRAVSDFRSICKYDFSTTDDDVLRRFDVEVDEADLDEIVDIVSQGMVVQWLKQYIYRQENLQAVLNTRDFTTFSSANLLAAIGDAHSKAQRDFVNMQREYSYRHGDLTALHL